MKDGEEDDMTQSILFLLTPVIFGALCLLLGETIQWLKKKNEEKDLSKVTVIAQSGRE